MCQNDFFPDYKYNNLAWCFDWEGLPRKPWYSTQTDSKSGNEIGQEVTFTCNEGYEFREDPVALPSLVTWIPFGGSEYYQGRDSSADSWQAARVRCQALGGGADLASITSLAQQNFLTETFTDLGYKKWIGGRLAGAGNYQWLNGDSLDFKHFSYGLNPTKECLAMKEDDGGKWEDQDCTKYDIDRFICQRESSNQSVSRSPANSSLDLEVSRAMSCVASGNTSAVWTYDYQVPSRCYSKLTELISLHSTPLLSLFSSPPSRELSPGGPGGHRHQQHRSRAGGVHPLPGVRLQIQVL